MKKIAGFWLTVASVGTTLVACAGPARHTLPPCNVGLDVGPRPAWVDSPEGYSIEGDRKLLLVRGTSEGLTNATECERARRAVSQANYNLSAELTVLLGLLMREFWLEHPVNPNTEDESDIRLAQKIRGDVIVAMGPPHAWLDEATGIAYAAYELDAGELVAAIEHDNDLGGAVADYVRRSADQAFIEAMKTTH